MSLKATVTGVRRMTVHGRDYVRVDLKQGNSEFFCLLKSGKPIPKVGSEFDIGEDGLLL